jgi:hypothetical protein
MNIARIAPPGVQKPGVAMTGDGHPMRQAQGGSRKGLTDSRSQKSQAFGANLLDKIRNKCNVFHLTESLSRSPADGREDEKPWLFETLAHNLPREPGRGSDFFTYIARNPLKRLDSQK